MDSGAILHELTYRVGLPRAALQAASAQRAELLPTLLELIEDHLGQEPAARAGRTPLFFIFHLLGEWREKTAYRPLARLLRHPPDEVDEIFGDATTSTCHRVMAAVFDGDPQPLFDIILDPGADEYIRSRMCEALAMITLRGELDRDRATRFLRDAFNELQPQQRCFVWFGWQSAIAMLGLRELTVLVRRAFDRGFIDRQILGFEHFEDDLQRGIEQAVEPSPPGNNEFESFLATPSKNYPDGTASPSETTRTGRSGGSLPSSITSSASRTIIHSGASAETTPVPVAAGRNSRSAACNDPLG